MENQVRDYLVLRQGSTPGLGKAPHKPILLLAVIRAFEVGLITKNEIQITAELVSLFRGYWQQLVRTDHSPKFYLPFYHLSNESSALWKHHTVPGFERIMTSSRSVNSLGALRAFVLSASLRDDVYMAWQSPVQREADRQQLLKMYFPDIALPPGEPPNYLGDIESQILKDPPAEYIKRIKALSDQPEEVIEEDEFLRGAAFKRQIPRIYEYRCAVTGMRIEAGRSTSIVDACHIVPFATSLDDTISNGIALCPNMHRAFDRGLIAISTDYTVLVDAGLVESDSAYSIRQFENRAIMLPREPKYRPSAANLANHRIRFGFE